MNHSVIPITYLSVFYLKINFYENHYTLFYNNQTKTATKYYSNNTREKKVNYLQKL